MADEADYVSRWQDPEYVANFARFTESVQEDAAEWIDRLSLDSASTVVDLGCGEGKVLAALSGHIRRGIGIDASPHMAVLAGQRLANQQNVHVILSDFRDFGVARESADAVLSMSAIHHVPDDDKRHIFAQIYATLKPGGVFYLADDSFNFAPEELAKRIAEIYDQWDGYFGTSSWEWMKTHLAGDDFECTPFLRDLREMVISAGLMVVKEETHGPDGVDLTAVKE